MTGSHLGPLSKIEHRLILAGCPPSICSIVDCRVRHLYCYAYVCIGRTNGLTRQVVELSSMEYRSANDAFGVNRCFYLNHTYVPF